MAQIFILSKNLKSAWIVAAGKRGCEVGIFNDLGFQEKCDIVRKHGQFILTLSYYHYTIKLYSWDRFFIEEYFDNEEDEVTRISMAGENNMEKYLHDIKLSELSAIPGFESYNDLAI